MSDRDEVAKIIAGEFNDNGCSDSHMFRARMATDLILAYMADPRRSTRPTVTTVEDLEALSVGTVLRYPDGEVGLVMFNHRTGERRIGYPGHLPTDPLDRVDLPATVLYAPKASR